MRTGGGKGKGNSFERKVCVQLSLAVTGGRRKDCFWRSAMSGGRATVHKKGAVRQAGDICAVAPEGNDFCERYYVECKAYRNLMIPRFVIEHKGLLWKFWVDTCKKAMQHGDRKPVMICHQNQLPTFVIDGCMHTPYIKRFDKWLQEDLRL